MQPRAWRVVFASGGCCPCQRRKVRPQAMHPSLHYFVFMSTCLPCLLVRRFLFRVPPIPATAATYRQHYHRYRQHLPPLPPALPLLPASSSQRPLLPPSRSPLALPPPPLPPLLRHWQPPPTATAALPLPASPTVAASAVSPFHRRHCRRLECRVLLCVTPDAIGKIAILALYQVKAWGVKRPIFLRLRRAVTAPVASTLPLTEERMVSRRGGVRGATREEVVPISFASRRPEGCGW